MKRFVLLAALLVATVGCTFAQKKSNVAEKNVPSRMVHDFQQQQLDARDVKWYQLDSAVYEVAFLDGDNALQSIRYSPRGTETRYTIDLKYCPQAIRDTVRKDYPKFKITDLNVKSTRRASTYEARIARTKGILFWKKEAEVKQLNFETDGKFIGEE